MIRQSKVWVAAGLLALSAACFSDPTKSLRGGASQLILSRSSITLKNGDSLDVTGYVVDEQGNTIPSSGVTWASTDNTIAVVHPDSARPIPGQAFDRAFVVGATNLGGVTTVTLTANGLTATARVTVLPATFNGSVMSASVTGTAGADTLTITRPSPQPPLVVIYTAGDTLLLTASGAMTFDAAASSVNFGPNSGMIVSRTATTMKVLARTAFAGRATVTNLIYAGSAETGPIAIASLQTDSFNIQHARFRGTGSVAADPAFGPNTVFTITAPAGVTFDATTGAGVGGTPAVGTTAAVAPTTLIILSRTATTLSGISPANATGTIVVRSALVGTGRIDSLRQNAVASGITITKAAFPGTFAEASGSLLIDTITISGGASATFTTTPAASASQVTIAGVPAQILSRSASTIKALSWTFSTGPIAISNVIVGGVTIGSLSTSANLAMSGTGEPNEPGNQSSGGATAITGIAALNDSAVIWGYMDGGADQRDYYKFTMPVTGAVSVRLSFFGNGSGSSDANPDFDVVVCTDTTLSGTGSCSYGQDIIPGNGASVVNQPEVGTTPPIGGGRTVFVRTFAYFATAGGTGVYRLRVKIQ